MKKVFVLLLLLILGGAGYFYYEHLESLKRLEESRYMTFYGNVEIRRVNLGFRVGGRISEFLFQEGDRIKKGDVIAKLDKEPFEDNQAVAESQILYAQANYDKLKAGSRPQEIEQAKATVNEREASLNVLEADFTRAKRLIADRVISQQEFETVEARRDEAIARKKLAEETLNLLTEGSRQEDIAAGKARLVEALANLKKLQTNLADTELSCPNDGILLTRVEEPGAVVREGQIIATLSLQNEVWVYIYVPETEFGQVVPGTAVEIFTDSARGKAYQGKVGSRSPEAEFTPKTVQTNELRTDLVFRIRIIVDNPGDILCQGMPVTVHVAKSKADQ